MNGPAEPPTVAVTGATGYVGSRVVEVLRTAHPEWTVRPLSHHESGPAIDGGIEHVDIRDRDRLTDALAGSDVVVHLAAVSGVKNCDENPELAYEVNVQGTNNVAWFCWRETAALVFPFSVAVLGTPESMPVTVDSPRTPMNWYGRTKVLGERAVQIFARGSFPAHLFLKSNIYGEHTANGERISKSTVINFFIERAMSGESLPVYEPGTQARDYVHVRDVGDAYRRSVERLVDELDDGTTGTKGYEIASEEQTDVLSLAELVQRTVADETGRSPDIELIENPRSNETLVTDFDVDTTRAERELGWQPDRSIRETVRRLVRRKVEEGY
ncbi:NAD(P)-dependent oxidoreductase [Haladaptatus sp. T7]|uniref:NAD-dependent epimerase/dehydratase family protein n=1 Tax=Haladaptatus sp. T7 TaxID=2029368 RepID=UPI0021A2591D|nr:NAD(P)-dependent oxidoreductase [Haladaptatus sp. T7]GKZ14666.1 UDP-glucose 4-epimerase GalE [Haladaptatus sp. T7]